MMPQGVERVEGKTPRRLRVVKLTSNSLSV